MNPRVRKWLIRGGIAVVLLVALGYGAIFIYANYINDSPDEFDADDLTEAVSGTAATGTASDPGGGVGTSGPGTGANDTADPGTTSDPGAATTSDGGDPTVDGAWQVTTDSQFGYRVDEVLAGVNTTAVGRGNQIEGTLSIDGAAATEAEFTVDVASITSDESRRDGQFRGRIMSVDQFPTATFTLTEPVEFGEVPAAGEQVEATATGDLTLHGVTRTVTFDVTAEAGTNRIGVLGAIPVLFSDYEIPSPSFGAVKTEDNGLLEFILVFART